MARCRLKLAGLTHARHVARTSDTIKVRKSANDDCQTQTAFCATSPFSAITPTHFSAVVLIIIMPRIWCDARNVAIAALYRIDTLAPSLPSDSIQLYTLCAVLLSPY